MAPAPEPDGGTAPTPPAWLANPEQSHGNLGLPSGPGIDVKPDSVKLFSDQMKNEVTTFVQNYSGGVTKIAGTAGRIGGGSAEGNSFLVAHGSAMTALNMFFADASQGLTALQLASFSIAINYIGADTSSQATMNDVDSAFHPNYGTGSLAYNQQQATQNPGGSTSGGPGSENGGPGQNTPGGYTLPPATNGTPTTANSGQSTTGTTVTLGSGNHTEDYEIDGDDEGISNSNDSEIADEMGDYGDDGVEVDEQENKPTPVQVVNNPDVTPYQVPAPGEGSTAN